VRKCLGTKRDGGQCTVTVNPPHKYCWWHDPANSVKRRLAASRGGKGKANRELHDLNRQLQELADEVRAGRLDRADAAVVNQILNTRLRLAELERKVKETQELSEQVEELETEIRARLRGAL
jgi:archaellum component FlaC